MTLKIIPLFAIAAIIVGCQSGSSTANTTPDTTKPAATADNAPKPDDSASTTGAPVTDAGAGSAAFVGKWKTDDKDMSGVSIEFKNDGTVTMIGPAPGGAPKGTTMEADATYKVDGDKCTLHITGAKMTAASDADAKTKDLVDKTNKQLSDPKFVQSQKDKTGTVKWNGKDSFTVTDADTKKTSTYTRAS